MSRFRLLRLTLGGLLLAAGGSAWAEPRTTQDAVYTKDQAKQGGKLYKQHCLVCHDKKYFRPVLKRWKGQSAAVFYDVMSASMPESNPGGLADQEYVDILAYIFSQSRYPSGDRELETGEAALAEITIQEP